MKRIITICSALALLAGIPPAPSAYAAESGTKNRKSETTGKRPAKVDVNTADAETLQTLPGIGPVTARAIIAARPFSSVDDLESVAGIGAAKLAELRDHVTVSRRADWEKKPSRSSKAASSPGTERSTRAERNVPPSSDRDLEPTGRTAAGKAKTTASAQRRININTATLEELEALPEIGPVKARAIIDARPFSSPEDIMRVTGIKEGTYEAIKDRITVGR